MDGRLASRIAGNRGGSQNVGSCGRPLATIILQPDWLRRHARPAMDFLISLIFSNPYIPWILLAAMSPGRRTRSWRPRLSVRVPGSTVSAGRRHRPGRWDRVTPSASSRRRSSSYKKEANYLAAGKVLEDHGDLAEAVEAYTSRAASTGPRPRSSSRWARGERAAELYLQAGDYKKAAAGLRGRRQARPGGRALPGEGEQPRGGAALRRGRATGTRPPSSTPKGGYPLRAAEAYEKKGEFLKAAEGYEKHFMENVSYAHHVLLDRRVRRPEERAAGRPALREGRAT